MELNFEGYREDLPDYDEVMRAVRSALNSPMEFDYITFSGNGEPTLHPDFPEIVEGVRKLKNRLRPDVKMALLSNSTGLLRSSVKKILGKIDMPIFKLDSGRRDKFYIINRPAREVEYDELMDALYSTENIYLQTVFVGGKIANSSSEDVDSYIKQIGKIKPRGVQIYSIDRPVPDNEVKRINPEQLAEIAGAVERETGVSCKYFHI